MSSAAIDEIPGFGAAQPWKTPLLATRPAKRCRVIRVKTNAMQGMALLLGLLASVHATAPQVWMPPEWRQSGGTNLYVHSGYINIYNRTRTFPSTWLSLRSTATASSGHLPHLVTR